MDDIERGKGFGNARSVLLFFLRFVAASLVLYLAYILVGRFYMMLVAHCARPLLALFGYPIVMKQAMNITEEISLNPIVFLSLVIAVTRVDMRTRIRSGVLGIVILTAANSVVVFLTFLSHYKHSEQLWMSTEFVNLTINFFLPILLWFLLMPVRYMLLPPNRSGP